MIMNQIQDTMILSDEQQKELLKIQSIFEKIETTPNNVDSEELASAYSLNYLSVQDIETEKMQQLSEVRLKVLNNIAARGAIEVVNTEGEIFLNSSFPLSDI